MIRLLTLFGLAVATLAAAAEGPTITGAVTAKVGEVVVIAVDGEPALPETLTLAEAVKTSRDWRATTRVVVSAPSGATATMTTKAILEITDAGLVPDMTVRFSGDSPGVYVVAVLIPPELLLHRVEVGAAPPPPPPDNPSDPPSSPGKISRVTYVYEKDQNFPPKPVASALQRLNATTGILASEFEEDSTSGVQAVPAQYRAAVEAARKAGLPALVVEGDGAVIRVVKSPQTEADVMGAIQ